ncbi:MAG: nucleotide sugar dehydrogenase [Candidatus Paceibacterota bacterium]|jgi:UDPglucose 6-dehydrogenase
MTIRKKKIGIIGLWHLGCVVASSLADAEHNVIGTDFDQKILEDLKNKKSPIQEPGLEELLNKNIKKGTLVLTNSFQQAITDVDFILIAFDTPVDSNDRLDLSPIYKACNLIAKYAPKKFTLVIMSQIPVGTSRELKKIILNKNKKLSFDIIYSPENLRLGEALKGFANPERIIIGLEKHSIKQKAEELFSFIKAPKIYMDIESAEMTKHAINTYLATSISFINELANLSEVLGVDIKKVIEGMKSDSRIGKRAFLNPGLGFSGGTLGRDIQVLRNFGKKLEIKTGLMDAVLKINKSRQEMLFKKINNIFSSLSGLNIGLLGLTYKAGTNTLRRSVAIEVARKLISRGVNVSAFDPMISEKVNTIKKLKISKSPYEIANDADALILMTDWPEFRKLDFVKIRKIMKKVIIIDMKNFLDTDMLKKLSFDYYGVGIKNIS